MTGKKKTPVTEQKPLLEDKGLPPIRQSKPMPPVKKPKPAEQ